MAKQTKNEPECALGAQEASPASALPSQVLAATRGLRLLVNPRGATVEYDLESPRFEEYLFSPRPPGVAPEKWFREATEEEIAAWMVRDAVERAAAAALQARIAEARAEAEKHAARAHDIWRHEAVGVRD